MEQMLTGDLPKRDRDRSGEVGERGKRTCVEERREFGGAGGWGEEEGRGDEEKKEEEEEEETRYRGEDGSEEDEK